MNEPVNCTSSPSGEHQYFPANYARDDLGFYLDCVHCGKTQFFECDTVNELYDLFGFGDDDE